MGPIGAGCWPDWPGRCREGALLVPLCAGERNQSRRDRGRLPQHHRRRNASNATRPTPTHSNTGNTRPPNAGPPRRGPKPRDDAAQLRQTPPPRNWARELARPPQTPRSASAPRRSRRSRQRESEESPAEAPELGAEAPRSNKGEDSTFAAQFTRFGLGRRPA